MLSRSSSTSIALPFAPAGSGAQSLLRELDRAALPSWFWLWSPIAFVASIPLARIVAPGFHERVYNAKEGPIEWLTVAVLIAGVGAGARAWRLRARLPTRRLRAWVLFLTLCSALFALEEVSWGQTLFRWSPPEAFERLNDQRETNLHNMSSWLDQKPRFLFELFVLVGGVLVPLRRSMRQLGPDDERAWFWPTRLSVPFALAALVVRLPDRWEKLAGRFEHPVLAGLRLSEPQELLFAGFLALLLCSLAIRLGSLGERRA